MLGCGSSVWVWALEFSERQMVKFKWTSLGKPADVFGCEKCHMISVVRVACRTSLSGPLRVGVGAGIVLCCYVCICICIICIQSSARPFIPVPSRLKTSLTAETSNASIWANVEEVDRDAQIRATSSNAGVTVSLPPGFHGPVEARTRNGQVIRLSFIGGPTPLALFPLSDSRL